MKPIERSTRRSPKLPKKLRPFFWDDDFNALTWADDGDFIIARILSAGTWEAVSWLREQLGGSQLRAWIQRRRGRGLDARKLRFWQLILGLPRRDVNAWIASPDRAIWEGRASGGTAAAIQLGHRRSVDLDWFTNDPSFDPMYLAQELRDEGIAFRTSQVARGTLHGTLSRVRVSFLQYRYPLLSPTITWDDYHCPLASLDDLACMKLVAVTQRGAKKDFVDIYALGLEHIALGEMLRLYQRKYSVEDVGHVLYALAYFDDADKQRMPMMLWDVDWRTIKKTIQAWIKEVAG